MTRTSIATDSFGAGDAILGSGTYPNWTQQNTVIAGSMQVLSGRVTGQFNGSPENSPDLACAFWSGAGSFTDDQYATASIPSISNLSINYGSGVTCRASGSAGTRTYFGLYAYALVTSSDFVTRLFKVVNGTYTSIALTNVAWVAGDTMTLECSGTSGAITLTCYQNASVIAALTQTTAVGPNTGAPGVIAGDDGFAPDGTLDNWEAGNLTFGASNQLSWIRA